MEPDQPDEPAEPDQPVEPDQPDEPAEEEACVVCASGLTVPETTPYGPRTCAQVLLDAAATTADTNRCNNVKRAEETCCPAPASDPCPVCPDGLTVDESTVINQAQGSTCGGLISDALNVESDSNVCESMLGAERLCCPGVSDGCPVCVDGLTVDESTVLDEGRGRTCATLIEDALTTDPDSNRCQNMKRSEATCCPPPAEDPCPVCPGGITVDGTTPVTDDRTCDNLVSDARTVESTDDICQAMLGLMETCCPEGSEVATTDAPVAPVTTDAPVAAVVTDAPVAVPAVATDAPVAVPAAETPQLPAWSPAPSFLAASGDSPGVTPESVGKVETPAPTPLRGSATDAPFAVAGGGQAVLPGEDVPSTELPESGGETPIEAPPAPSVGVRRTATAAGGAAALLWSLAQFA